MPLTAPVDARNDAQTAVTRDRTAGPLQAHLLLAIACLPILGMLVISPVLPDMQRHFSTVDGVEYLIPLALTSPALMIALVSPFAGRITARFGRKSSLIASLCSYLLAATAPLWLDSLWTILASRLLVGVAEALLMTISTMLLGDYFEPSRRDRYLGVQVVYTSVSAICFLILGGLLGESGWRAPFAAYFVTLAIIPLAATLIWEPTAPVSETRQDHQSVPWPLVHPVCAITFVAGGCMNLVSVDLGFLLETVGTVSSTMKGLGAAANSIGIAAGAAIFSLIATRYRLWQLNLSFVLAACGFAALAIAPGAAGIVLGAVLAGLASGFYLGWLSAAVNRPLSYANRGRAIGAWMSSYFLGTVIAPASAVALTVATGGLRKAMFVYAGAMLLMVLLAWGIVRAPMPDHAVRSK